SPKRNLRRLAARSGIGQTWTDEVGVEAGGAAGAGAGSSLGVVAGAAAGTGAVMFVDRLTPRRFAHVGPAMTFKCGGVFKFGAGIVESEDLVGAGHFSHSALR